MSPAFKPPVVKVSIIGITLFSLTPPSPFKPVKAKSKIGFSVVPPFVTCTDGTPVVSSTDAVAVISGVTPFSPVAPRSPFKPVKAKSKIGFSVVPPFVTCTDGTPVVSSTDAVAVISGVTPSFPFSPLSPLIGAGKVSTFETESVISSGEKTPVKESSFVSLPSHTR